MNFTPDFLDEIRARLSVSEIIGKSVKLQRRGREFVGLSPFNAEKTPSFTVNDQKGFYHCFSSGKHGDIFRFLMETQGLSFPEAVERLAGEAGVPMPARRPGDEERQKKRNTLYDVTEKAAAFFEKQIFEGKGSYARQYLKDRGLEEESWKKFRIGFAPNSRHALKDYLATENITQEQMIEAGMLIAGEDIAVSYDRFRNRIIFPITDVKERVIAFGGRALDPSVPAKYLNSPETPLFHKGSVLYNHAGARKSAYDAGNVVLAEGYMDVIALSLAGITQSAAPLGTALTQNQLHLLWRMAPEPVLCFDGDKAGLKAAFRAIDLALPELRPGFSLRFALLPDGLDPDDFIRDRGAEAMKELLGKALPLSDMLWTREVQAGEWDTPERRASLERVLEVRLSEINDPKVRRHYETDLRARLQKLWGGSDKKSSKRYKGQPKRHRGTGALRRSAIGQGAAHSFPAREILLIVTPVHHPELLERHAERLVRIDFTSPELDRLRQDILDAASRFENLDREALTNHLEKSGHAPLLSRLERKLSLTQGPRQADDDDSMEKAWLQAANLHHRQVTLEKELRAAELACSQAPSEENFTRLAGIRSQYLSMEGLEAAFEDQDV